MNIKSKNLQILAMGITILSIVILVVDNSKKEKYIKEQLIINKQLNQQLYKSFCICDNVLNVDMDGRKTMCIFIPNMSCLSCINNSVKEIIKICSECGISQPVILSKNIKPESKEQFERLYQLKNNIKIIDNSDSIFHGTDKPVLFVLDINTKTISCPIIMFENGIKVKNYLLHMKNKYKL